MTNLGDLKLNELIPADGLNIARGASRGPSGPDQVLNGTGFVTVTGTNLTLATAGTYFILATFLFYYDDRDVHNKKNVHFEGILGVGFFSLGAPATCYAPAGHETLRTAVTTAIATPSAGSTLYIQARALDDTGTALPDRAVVDPEFSGIHAFQL